MLFSDESSPPEAVASDLSDVVSTNDEGHSSTFANYGDDTGDQCSLGRRFARDLIVHANRAITCL